MTATRSGGSTPPARAPVGLSEQRRRLPLGRERSHPPVGSNMLNIDDVQNWHGVAACTVRSAEIAEVS